ncbi:MAG: 2-polyprenyl-6-hydroxyphenyl methylase / 3-demethylubiquinone-9 3-methyltransferase [Bacteroidetes bacterium]|nr:MAG: 2-polyprenyl-6-hydroxyphenyl methylase / 3-demethylubiquinone-9 3-methyltransferase [Bacteroidota bacterium]
MTIFQRGVNFIRYRIVPPHNMHTHAAERFYFGEYMLHLSTFFAKGKSLLDIGCQNGRFTIPAIRAGMEVTATDIRASFFRYIKGKLHTGDQVIFRKEGLDQTCKVLTPGSFDVVMCIELLYNLPDTAGNIEKLAMLAKPGGVVIASHRSVGYYVYRFIKERNFKAVSEVLNGTHPYYNAQTPEELDELYRNSGLRIQKIIPIGMFSGFGKDTFSCISNPKRLNPEESEELFKLETEPGLIRLFGNNARYWLVIAEKET